MLSHSYPNQRLLSDHTMHVRGSVSGEGSWLESSEQRKYICTAPAPVVSMVERETVETEPIHESMMTTTAARAGASTMSYTLTESDEQQ